MKSNMTNIELIYNDIKCIFNNQLNISIKTAEDESKPLFYYNSPFTPTVCAYLFSILKKKYKIQLSYFENEFKNEITFNSIVNYVNKYNQIQ